jgi:glycosyltransferase involved in cell wall biosynthesis
MPGPRVLVLHNRYRIEGGEERSVALQLAALRDAGIEHRALERRSSEVSRPRAAAALLRGGARAGEIAAAVADLGAGVVHAHNMQPLIGPRGLAAARAAGARVVLHLHNARLFCAIGVASRDGGPCFRCHGRNTLPGLVLNCRGSVPEAAAYAVALAAQQPRVFDAVDRFVAPSEYAVGQLALLGVPRERLEVLPHFLPSFASDSSAASGRYALVAGRLSVEKGVDVAIQAAAKGGVPLKIAGDGPEAPRLTELAARLGAPVEFLGRLERDALAERLRSAAMVVMPSRYHEFSPYAALEAMAAGVPVVASALGGLPELLGPGRCVAAADVDAFAERMSLLWEDPSLRANDGEEGLGRVRRLHSQAAFTERLLGLYERVLSH